MQPAVHNHPRSGSVTGSGWPIAMLLHRFVLFLVGQALIAGVYLALGHPSPWSASVAWWPVTITLTNLISFALQCWLAAREGVRWSELIHADFRREHLAKDLLALLGVLLVSAPVAMAPNLGLAQLLFGSQEAALALFIQPLPIPLVVLLLLPITQGLAELPTYFAYAMPRLERGGSSPARALLMAAFWLGAQHATAPFIPDLRFILWRLLMFIPFAIWVGLTLRWRPRLLPYLMGVHVLLDLPLALMVWQASTVGA